MYKLKIKLNEQAASRDEYIPTAYSLEELIYCHCAYFLVFDMPQVENHWKTELYGFIKKLKKIKVSSGSKAEYTETALVTMAHGRHFCEDLDDPTEIFSAVYESEEIPHSFDYNMLLENNRDIYFKAIDKFYYEFLIPWIAIPVKDPLKEPLYSAIDNYLVSRRKDMVQK